MQPGSQRLTEGLFKQISEKLIRMGRDPESLLDKSNKKLPSGGLIDVPKVCKHRSGLSLNFFSLSDEKDKGRFSTS